MAVAQSDVAQAFAAGDPKALATAYNMWGALVYTVALRGAGDPAVAADLTQRTFVSVWHGGGADSGLSLKSRLVLTARTLVHQTLLNQQAPVAAIDEADGVIDRVVVRDELTAMPEPGRSIMLRTLGDQATPEELADGETLPPEAVAVIVRDGVVTMAMALESSRGV